MDGSEVSARTRKSRREQATAAPAPNPLAAEPGRGCGCGCGCGPWITPTLLQPAGPCFPGLYRCPDRHCLRATAIVAGRIADHVHGRNVAGPCPWVGTQVATAPPPCGCGPTITTGHLRIVCRHRGQPRGAVTAISCPGGCTNLAPVHAGHIAPHKSCPWVGVRIHDSGLYPPVLAAQQ